MRSAFAAAVVLVVAVTSTQTAAAHSRWPAAVIAVTRDVAHVYRATHVRIAHVQTTRTDSTPTKPMYFITLSGTFHKGKHVARILDFSALANRSYIWGIVAFDAHNHIIWTDPTLPRPHRTRIKRYDGR